MLSTAGKLFDKCRQVKPMDKDKREKMYASTEIQAEPQIG